MKRIWPLALAVLLSIVGVAGAEEKVLVCGTGDSQELLRILGAAFEKSAPGVSVVVPDSVGSDGGVKAAASGECDFGRVARALKEQERELNLTYKVFAFSPVVFVVDPAAGVEGLSAAQIVDIYRGKITAWKEVGGSDAKIAVVNREPKDSSRNELKTHLKGFKDVENPVGVTAGKTPEAVELIAKTPNVIGYLPAAMTKGLARRIVKVDGTEPSAASVVQGKYGLVTPFGLVWKGQLKPAAKRFHDFIKSAEGKKIIIDSGVVPSDML